MTALWVVNLFYKGIKYGTCPVLHVPYEEGRANAVTAAAVIGQVQALSGFSGFKGSADGLISVT